MMNDVLYELGKEANVMLGYSPLHPFGFNFAKMFSKKFPNNHAARVDWAGLDKILRGMRARNEEGQMYLTNWIADNKRATIKSVDVEGLKNALRDVLAAIVKDRKAVQDTIWVGDGAAATPIGDFIMCALDEDIDLDELQNSPYRCNKTHEMFAKEQDYPAARGFGVPKSERQILCEALERIGWNEIKAFKDELRKGQSIYEDAGGYFKRSISRLFGIAPREEAVTYKQAAQKIIDELTAAPKKEGSR